MKNKLVINIIVAYFVVLCIVFLVQLQEDNTEDTSQVQTVEVSDPEFNRMKDTAVIKIGSSSVLMNDKLFSINNNDETIVPKIVNSSAYVPYEFFSVTFGNQVSWDNDSGEFVIRDNNKAVVLKKGEKKIRIIDNLNNEENIEIQNDIDVVDKYAYVPLRDIAKCFDKDVYMNNDFVFIGSEDIKFDDENEGKLTVELGEKFKMRNVFVFQKNNQNVYCNNEISQIDETSKDVVPVDNNGQTYIPVKMVSSNFGGKTTWNGELKELDIEYNNVEASFTSKSDKVTITKKGEKSEIQMPNAFKIINGYSYLSLDAFIDVFEKNILIDSDYIIMSGKDNLLAKEKDGVVIDKLEKNIKNAIVKQ